MRRTDLHDTIPEVHRDQMRLLRSKTPEWRLQKACDLCDLSRAAYPEQTKRMIREEMRAHEPNTGCHS